MSMGNSFQDSIKKLSQRIKSSEVIAKHGQEWEDEETVLAISLLEIEESFRKIFDVLLPRIESETRIDPVLWEIGEELRHIIYHIHDTRYFSYLKEQGK